MDFIADILLAGGAFAAAIYCLVLSRRLNRFGQLEGGVGGAIAGLASQVEELKKLLEAARGTARESSASLEGLTGRAEGVAEKLEIMLGALNDLPEGRSREGRRFRIVRSRLTKAVPAE